MDQNYHIKDYCLINKISQRKTYDDGLHLAATSLTTNSPPVLEEKNSPKLEKCLIFIVVKDSGNQTLVFIKNAFSFLQMQKWKKRFSYCFNV